MPSDPRLIELGEFGRAVGLKGEVRLKSFTAEPEAIARYNPLTTPDGRVLRIVSVRSLPGTADMLVARVEGITTREAAEALNRVTVSVPRDRLPEPEEGEFLLADLIGLKVETPDGTVHGEVVDVANYGAGDIVEVKLAAGGPTVLVPFEEAFVPEVDLEAGRLVIAHADLIAPDMPGRKS
jgi:16S rRNA processing protein RimM